MDNGRYGVPLNMSTRNSVILDGIPSHTAPHSLLQLVDSFDFNNQNQVMAGFPVLSTLQEESMDDINAEPSMSNHTGLHSNALLRPYGRDIITEASFGNLHGIGQFAEGTLVSATSLGALLATRNNLQENLNRLAISAPAMTPPEVPRNYISNDCCDASNSSIADSANCGYNEVLRSMNSEWDFNRFSNPQEVGGNPQESTGVHSFLPVVNFDPNGWISSNCANVNTASSEELSLSLATSHSSVISGKNIPEHCKESCSSVSNPCLDETRFMSGKQTSCNSKELSLSVGSSKPAEFSQIVSGSGYLPIIQDVLAQIASYSLENLNQMNYSTSGTDTTGNPKNYPHLPAERGMLLNCDEYPELDGRFKVQMEPLPQRWTIEAKRTQLLTLLQVVDDHYNQCLDEIHTVISAFHVVTELDPQIHVQFALRTISFFYKNLRERISNQILAIGAYNNNGSTREEETSFENSFIKKQWALEQQKRKEQVWRPQRGLPERSVSVLRAWMFQNFLHPYPKDAEKHLLAVKSGLTRSQVSNWFINARVRLWKPMIEEMYSEMNLRREYRNEGANRTQTMQMSTIKQI